MVFVKDKTFVNSIDVFFKDNKLEKIDFIWMDVQGAEVDVFKGAKNTLSKIHYIYTEFCESELYEGEIGLKEILKLLPNFKIIENYGGDVLLENEKFCDNR